VEGEAEDHGRRNKMSGRWNRISWKVTLKIMEEGTKWVEVGMKLREGGTKWLESGTRTWQEKIMWGGGLSNFSLKLELKIMEGWSWKSSREELQ
jgi:hypothetical protein